MANNYSLDDGNGNQLTTGLQEHEAHLSAQRLADERGEPVYLYSTEDGVQSRYETIEPSGSLSSDSDPANASARAESAHAKIVTIMIDLPHAALVYAMATAHTRYWCEKKSLRSGWRVIETNNGADERTYDVSLMDLARGASLLARIAPIHFGYLINDRADANTTRSWKTGDLLLQLSIFGEIKYS